MFPRGGPNLKTSERLITGNLQEEKLRDTLAFFCNHLVAAKRVLR